MNAVRAGDKAKVEALIAGGANVNAEDYTGTPLYNAASYSNPEIAELLIAKGADVNAKQTKSNFSYLGWTPLHRSALGGRKDVAALLLSKHANVNARSEDGSTPLHIAASNGQKDLADLLLSKGADVNAKNNNGWSPLFVAKDNDVAFLLIAKGADVHARSNNAETPLHIAALYGHTATADLLIAKGADLNAKDKDGETPLYEAVVEDKQDTVNLLLAKGADVSVRNHDGRTPLYTAGKKELAEDLIAKGADVNARDNDGYTPLFAAAGSGKTDVVALLIAKGADVNATNNEGKTPLFAAAGYFGKKEVAELLIASGANPNARDKYKETPLYSAATDNNKAVAEVLIAKGANVNVRSIQDFTPFDMALIQYHPEIAAMLLAHGADVNAKDAYDRTELHLAVSDGRVDFVKLLLDHGADLHAKDKQNRTPLDGLSNIYDAAKRQQMQTFLLAAVETNAAAANASATAAGSPTAANSLGPLLAEFKGHSDNEIVRAAIINLALKQHPPVPAEAEAAAGRASYIFKNSTSTEDKLRAAKEFIAAIELAPWVANYYFNLCTVLEKTPYAAQALHACKLYLVAAPNAADAGEMKQRIAGLQYAADRDLAQMKLRTAYIQSRGIDDLYRFGGITGTVGGQEIALKLFVDWTASPPRYQVYAGCLAGKEASGEPHDLVTTDKWVPVCTPTIHLHLIIQPEGEGFVSISDNANSSLRATFDDLFKAKQQTMDTAVMFSIDDRFLISYAQGGVDAKHAGYAFYASDCNGAMLKKDPRALPDDFLSLETKRATGFGRFFPEVILNSPNTDVCTREFISKTTYRFGENQ